MKLKIAIPSYKRPEQIKKMSLALLEEAGIENSSIYIFVSNQKEYEDYSYLKDASYNLVYIKDLSNLQEKHNFIMDYFDVGERIVVMEDDIKCLKRKNGNRVVKYTDFKKLVNDAWEHCDKLGTKLWGVYPMANGMFMDESITSKLICIAGYLFGVEITKDPFLRCNTENKHDYERSILYYVKYGSLCRINYIAQYSSSFTNKGGLQAQHSNEERCKNEIKGNDYLVHRFPHLVKKHNRMNKVFDRPTELRMMDIDKDSKQDLFALQKLLDKQNGYSHG